MRWILAGIAALALACGSDTDDSSSSAGGGNTSVGGNSSVGGGGSCLPGCFAPNRCVTTCGDTPTDYGCCPCPAGTINELSCMSDCGLVGTTCPGATTCGNGLTCTGAVCAPDGPTCAPPPGGVGCSADTDCLVVTGTAAGICVTPEEQTCLCSGGGSFDCP
jgi:hypothetical protein